MNRKPWLCEHCRKPFAWEAWYYMHLVTEHDLTPTPQCNSKGSEQ